MMDRSEETPPPATAATSLSWMPVFVEEMLSLSATLTAAQFGGLMRLRFYAWRQSPAATLPDSDARLATISGLGASWTEDGPAIREHLRPIGDIDGTGPRLLDPWLEAVYLKQLARYMSASERGRKGGRPKGETKGGGKAPEKLGESSAFNQLRNPLSSVLDSSSITQSPEETEAKGKLSFSGTDDDPYRLADRQAQSEAGRRDAEARALGEQYESELAAEVERFRLDHPAEYEAARVESIKALGLFGRELSDRQQESVDGATAERVRRDQGWVSRAAYLANHGRPAPTVASLRREKVPA